MTQEIWIVITMTFILTFASYLLASNESFKNDIDPPSPYGQGYYFGPHIPGPAWAYSPRDSGWD